MVTPMARGTTFDEARHRRDRTGRFAPSKSPVAPGAATAAIAAAAPDDQARLDRIAEAEHRVGHPLDLSRLDPHTADLMDRRFGFTTGTPSTVAAEADRLGITPIEVRRREVEALGILRD